ncbi:hypothetical protein D9M68_794520 [compost metagenome]
MATTQYGFRKRRPDSKSIISARLIEPFFACLDAVMSKYLAAWSAFLISWINRLLPGNGIREAIKSNWIFSAALMFAWYIFCRAI